MPAKTVVSATPADPRAPTAAAVAPVRPVVRFRMRVMRGDVISIGPGKITLLEAIEQTRSITAAAKSIRMSYRRAWLLVDEINASLKEPAVHSDKGGEHGGGSRLTAVGQQVVDLYRRIEAQAHESGAADIERLLQLLDPGK